MTNIAHKGSHIEAKTNGLHLSDDIFKCISLNQNVWISIEISLRYVPKGPISNNPALIQIMAWRRSGDKPLSEPMIVRLLTRICVTRPQRVTFQAAASIYRDNDDNDSINRETFFPNDNHFIWIPRVCQAADLAATAVNWITRLYEFKNWQRK